MSDGRFAVRGQSHWLETATDALPGIIWSTDAALRITCCHGQELSSICAQPDQLSGTSLYELFGTEDVRFPPYVAHRQALHGEMSSISFTLHDKTFRGFVAPLRLHGKVTGCVCVAFPPALTEARCDALFSVSVDLVLFLSPTGIIEEVNRTAGGSPRERVVGRSVFEFMPRVDHERLQAALRKVVETGSIETLEICFPRRFDNPAWQTMRIGPIRMMNQVAGLIMVAQDTTQHKQVVKKLEAEEGLLRDLLELQDRERRLVAYEIHDGFIQDVVGARMILQGIRRSQLGDDASVQKRLDTAVSLMGRAINEGRRLISELRPMIIDEMGIIDAIDYLIGEEEARGGLEIRFTHRMQLERLPPLIQATMFRIIREAVNNSRRHGQATLVEIRLTQIGSQDVLIEIQDNGIGFDPDSTPRDRYGLAGICERARLFGGGATIESIPGEGTRITVKLALDTPRDLPVPQQPDWTWTV